MTTTEADGLRAALATLPKIDLHRHLEGSLRLETLAEIAREHGLDLPSSEVDDLRPLVQIVDDQPDFHGFLAKFRLLRHFFSTRETVERLAYESVADAAEDNIKYLELRFNPVALSKMQGFDYEEVTDWVVSAVNRAQRDHDIQVRLIAQIGRDETVAVAQRITEVAAAFQDQGLAGIDLAGDETDHPATRFAAVFQRARADGLHITVHAGEAGPASNIQEAIELLGAERIGHGVRAMEDQMVIDLLVRRKVTLEMCPTSNLQTGAVSDLSQHPLKDYLQANVRVTVNTDDPSISDTTLTNEYLVAVQRIGMPLPALRQSIIVAAESAFLPDGDRRELREWFDQALPTSLSPECVSRTHEAPPLTRHITTPR